MAQYVLSNVTPTGRTLEPENRTITDIRWKPCGHRNTFQPRTLHRLSALPT